MLMVNQLAGFGGYAAAVAITWTGSAPNGGSNGTNLVDNDTGTVATTFSYGNLSGATADQRTIFQIDAGQNVTVDEVRLKSAANTASLTTAWQVEYSTDGSSWSSFGTAGNWTAGTGANDYTKTASAVTARYLRWTITATNYGAMTCSAGEFEAWNGGVELT